MWLETGVLESELIPTSCKSSHNQDLYIYSSLPPPLGQIVISAQSVTLAFCLFSRSCYSALLVFLPYTICCPLLAVTALSLAPVPHLTTNHLALDITHHYYLGFPSGPVPLFYSTNSNLTLHSWFLQLIWATPVLHSPILCSIYLFVHSSRLPLPSLLLGSPPFAHRNRKGKTINSLLTSYLNTFCAYKHV